MLCASLTLNVTKPIRIRWYRRHRWWLIRTANSATALWLHIGCIRKWKAEHSISLLSFWCIICVVLLWLKNFRERQHPLSLSIFVSMRIFLRADISFSCQHSDALLSFHQSAFCFGGYEGVVYKSFLGWFITRLYVIFCWLGQREGARTGNVDRLLEVDVFIDVVFLSF